MTTTTATATSATTTSGQDLLALLARLLIAAIFVLAGVGKIADPAGTIGYIQSAGLPLPQAAYGGAVAIEVLGGLALIAGFRTRAVALVLAGFTLLTGAIFHHQLADQTQFIMFFKNLAMAGGLLQIAAFGPGRFALGRR